MYVVLFQALVFEFGLLVSVSKQNAILPIFANGVAQERLNLEDAFRVAGRSIEALFDRSWQVQTRDRFTVYPYSSVQGDCAIRPHDTSKKPGDALGWCDCGWCVGGVLAGPLILLRGEARVRRNAIRCYAKHSRARSDRAVRAEIVGLELLPSHIDGSGFEIDVTPLEVTQFAYS